MTRVAIAIAAAGMLLAAPNFASATTSSDNLAGVQLAQLSVKIGSGHSHDRRDWHRHNRCRSTVVYRHGRKTVVRRCY